MRASRAALAALGSATVAAGLAAGVAAGGVHPGRPPSQALSKPLPSLVRIGQLVSVTGQEPDRRARDTYA